MRKPKEKKKLTKYHMRSMFQELLGGILFGCDMNTKLYNYCASYVHIRYGVGGERIESSRCGYGPIHADDERRLAINLNLESSKFAYKRN